MARNFTRLNQQDLIARVVSSGSIEPNGFASFKLQLGGETRPRTVLFRPSDGAYVGAADLRGCTVAVSLVNRHWLDRKTGEKTKYQLVTRITVLHRPAVLQASKTLEAMRKQVEGA